MGARPKSGGAGGGANGGQRKFDHLAQYAAEGAYIVDEATGQYSAYDAPSASEGHEVDWAEIREQPRLIYADFQSEYGIDLRALGDRLSWQRFVLLVEGLLHCNSRLYRALTPPDDDHTDDSGEV